MSRGDFTPGLSRRIAVQRSPVPGTSYRGPHTVHFLLALVSACTAVGVLALNLWAYYDEGRALTQLGFTADFVATAVLFITWFWGMFLAMSGTLPRRRIGYLVAHGLLGSLTPLIYPLVIGLQMDSVGTQPVGQTEVVLELLALPVMAIQFLSGWSVLRRPIWARIVQLAGR